MTRRTPLASLLTAVFILGLAVPASATPSVELASVVVVFDDAVADPGGLAAQLGRQHGFIARHVYATALKGFVATVPERAAAALAAHPRVASVETEVAERIVDQEIPTGIDRIEVDKNPTVTTDGSGAQGVNLPLAIIDTGIYAGHSDLNVAGGRNFAGGSAGDWHDGNGHGTHVAGSAAAKDNGIGVVGVAPGASVWAVKVCKNGGICMSGDIIAGIDWVAQQKASGAIDFAAANFSISSSDSKNSCSSPANATHRAICGAVAEGVVFVMAGGNEARKKDAYPVAFSVAAIADFDGKAGAAGSPTCRSDEDDTLANFSNWSVDIAAPGTCILSTWNDGGYRTISGTSMAAPHVTGAVALYLHSNGVSPATDSTGAANIKSSIINAALAQSHDCGYTNERGSSEKLLFVNGSAFGGNGSCEVATGGGGETPPEDPGDPGEPSGTMSVALAGSSSTQGRNFWRAHADATVSTESGAVVSDATVSGDWTDGDGSAVGSTACTTGSGGTCRMTLSKIPNSLASVTFTVTGVTHATLTWDGVAPSVTIARPANASMR